MEELKFLKLDDIPIQQYIMQLSPHLYVYKGEDYYIFEYEPNFIDEQHDNGRWHYRVATRAECLLIKELLETKNKNKKEHMFQFREYLNNNED